MTQVDTGSVAVDPQPDPPAAPSALRLIRVLALLPAAFLGLAMIWSSSVIVNGVRYFTLLDDALISMTYARTLARTGELVWFPGADRVEGFTNPGYTLIMAIPHAIGLDNSQAALFMSLFGLGTALLTGYLAGSLALRLHPGAATAVATVLTVTCCFPLLFWSTLGLEVGLIAALLVAMLVLAVRAVANDFPTRSLVGMAVLAAAGILVRPDFIVAAGAVALWLLLLPAPGRWRRSLVVGLAAVGALAAITIARLWYYGAATPNTYDLKVGNSTLVMRVGRAWQMDTEALWLLAILLVATAVVWRWGSVARRPELALFLGVAVVQTGYTYYVGGDTFHPDRFLVPVTILATVVAVPAALVLPRTGRLASAVAGISALALAVIAWRSLPSPAAPLALAALAVLIAVGAVPALRAVWRPGLALLAVCVSLIAVTAGNDIAGYRGWANYGAALWPLDRLAILRVFEFAEITEPDTVIGVFGAGSLPYWAERPAVDLLGKSDRTVARQERRERFVPGHDKWDYLHSVVGQLPDVVDADLLDATSDVSRTFPASPAERAAIAELYERRCLPSGGAILVRKDTDRILPGSTIPCPAA